MLYLISHLLLKRVENILHFLLLQMWTCSWKHADLLWLASAVGIATLPINVEGSPCTSCLPGDGKVPQSSYSTITSTTITTTITSAAPPSPQLLTPSPQLLHHHHSYSYLSCSAQPPPPQLLNHPPCDQHSSAPLSTS